MEIIAKTDNGYLINGTEEEVKEILRAVNGKDTKDIEIGQKIPAIDYAATITKLKSLPNQYEYQRLISSAKEFSETIKELDNIVKNSTNL